MQRSCTRNIGKHIIYENLAHSPDFRMCFYGPPQIGYGLVHNNTSEGYKFNYLNNTLSSPKNTQGSYYGRIFLRPVINMWNRSW